MISRKQFSLFFAFGLALAPQCVNAQSTRFALVCIGTETGYEVNFSARWGKSGRWSEESIRPGKWKIFTWNYDYPGEDRSPMLNIHYDDDLSEGSNFVTTALPAYAASTKDCEAQGKTFNFYSRGDELYIQEED